MNVGIILAGGSGERVGAQCPKQFIEVLGKPVLAYTMEAFQNDGNIDALEVVCQDKWIGEVRQIIETYHLTKTKWIAPGGETFQESTWNGVSYLKGKLAADDIVVISFGVAPMTTADIIDDGIRVCKEHGNAIAAADMVLCTCFKDDDYGTTQSVLRENLKGFANPWTFKFGELYEAYETAIDLGILDELEPHTTSLYLALGKRLWFSKTNSLNIKITTKEDLDLFEGMLLVKEKREYEAR